jgi:hypothetical protein
MGRASNRKRHRGELETRRIAADSAQRERGLEIGCLVCRRRDGGFTGREHPCPESLGNTEIVLPPGVVCDRCNNGTLAVLDQTICDFMPVKMRRTMLGVRSKAGTVPTTRVSEGVIQHTGPSALSVLPNGGKRMVHETFRSGNTVGLRLNMTGRLMTARYGSELSRALLKTALELAWIDHGETMHEPKFDHIRHAILGSPRSGFFAAANRGEPDEVKISITYSITDGEQARLSVVGNYFGVILMTDSLLEEPMIPLDAHASVLRFTPDDCGR